jgi:riboflavin biosynthesis pyrimidine reductase
VTVLEPLQALSDTKLGTGLPLPDELASIYGHLQLPPHPGRPYLAANFVTTLDGVVSLDTSGHMGGGEISGFNHHDRMVMGLLRAVADAVIVGAGTLRASPDHLWTAEYIYPPLASAYKRLRATLGKREPPLNVFVTARGELDPDMRVFRSGEVPVLIVTTANGMRRMRNTGLPPSVEISRIDTDTLLSARAIVDSVSRVRRSDVILIEGGPHLMASFFAERILDELFLTLAPQVAGRNHVAERPGLVSGRNFAPENPLWGALVSVKRGGSHLFLRYRFRQWV